MGTINLQTPHDVPWLRQFPNSIPEWNGWKFIFNADDEPYDYLVAFDDLHSTIIPKCPIENTIHITTEPSAVLEYHPKFTDQFAWLITHNQHAYRSGVIKSPPHISWFVGWHPDAPNEHDVMPFEEVSNLIDSPKHKLI